MALQRSGDSCVAEAVQSVHIDVLPMLKQCAGFLRHAARDGRYGDGFAMRYDSAVAWATDPKRGGDLGQGQVFLSLIVLACVYAFVLCATRIIQPYVGPTGPVSAAGLVFQAAMPAAFESVVLIVSRWFDEHRRLVELWGHSLRCALHVPSFLAAGWIDTLLTYTRE